MEERADIGAVLRGRLIEAREATRLSQAEVAAELGVDPSAVSKIESGAREVSSTELFKLAQIYGRSLLWFFGKNEVSPLLLRGENSSPAARRELAWFSDFVDAYASLERELAAPSATPPSARAMRS